MELEVGSVEEVIENASDSDVDVDDTSSSVPHLSSAAQLLMQATQSTQKPPPTPKAKGKLVATPAKAKAAQAKPTTSKQGNLMTQSAKQANLLSQAAKQATLMSQAVKQANLLSQSVKQAQLAKQASQTKPTPPLQAIKQTNVAQTKQATVTQKAPQTQTPKPNTPKQANVVQTKPASVAKPPASPKSVQAKQTVVGQAKPAQQKSAAAQLSQASAQAVTQISNSLPSVVAPPLKSPLIKQRPLQRVETSQTASVSVS